MWFLALQRARETNSSVLDRRDLFFPHSRGNFGKFLCLFQVVSHIFQKAKATYSQQRNLGTRGKGLKPRASTLVSKFQESLQDLTAKLRR